MARSIPIIITNSDVLVYNRQTDTFESFEAEGIELQPNIPFYHNYAEKIADTQRAFKNFMKEFYPERASKNILAVMVPDDTSPLESIFINEFFVNSGTCKAVAQMKWGQALAKDLSAYVSISKTARCIVLQYVKNNEILAQRYYDNNYYNIEEIREESLKLHIDIEYNKPPVFVNNFNLNMDEFFDMGRVISPKEFMGIVSAVDVEKV